MTSSDIRLSGAEWIEKLLAGERDFAAVKLERYSNLSGHDGFLTLQRYLKDADLAAESIILDNADLTGVDADGLYMPFLKATGACFKHAALMESNLQSSQLRSADLRYARLPEANLTGSDLRDADLRQTDLSLAICKNCQFGGANLAGTNLWFANIESSHIHGILNLAKARSVETTNFQFVSLSDAEKAVIRAELWAQQGKKRRLFGGAG